MTSFKEYYGTDKQSLLNEVINAPFGAGNRVWNPWPDEPLPDPNDTKNYRGANFGGGKLKLIDVQSILPNEFKDQNIWLKLPPNQQRQILTKIVKDYAAKSGINMNSTWGQDMLNKANRGDSRDVLQNLYYSQTQQQQQAKMNPQQQIQYQDFVRNKQNLGNEVREYLRKTGRNQRNSPNTDPFNKKMQDYLVNMAQYFPQEMTANEREELQRLATKYRDKGVVDAYQKGVPVWNPSSSTAPKSNQVTLNQATTPQQQPGFFQTAKSAVQGLANSPAIKPLTGAVPNIAQRVASNPLVRTANALNPANLVATGLGAYNNLRNNYNVNVGGTVGTSGVGVGGTITPKNPTQGRSGYYGGIGVVPNQTQPGLTAGVNVGRYTTPNSQIPLQPRQVIQQPVSRSQTVTAAPTTTRPQTTQAYLPAPRQTAQQPVQQVSSQQPPRYSKGNVPSAIAFFQRYGRWPNESEL